MIKRTIYAITLTLFTTSIYASHYWFKTRIQADSVRIEYVDRIDCGGYDALGCYRESYGKGVIQIRKGLPAYVESCVLKHEKKHANGEDHPTGLQPFIDCGNGTWISSEALQRLGLL